MYLVGALGFLELPVGSVVAPAAEAPRRLGDAGTYLPYRGRLTSSHPAGSLGAL
ncbi:hypothetical protein [Streptomyces bluensis]|uniref:hypothetical protein n=1 Tax=Streptomyces bluensis TaxID=33897 RepID=UPI00331A8280